MAVLRQDLLRSTFQEKQIDLLESLDKNMSRTTDASVASAKFLEDRLLQRLDMMFDNLSISINNKSSYGTALEGLTRVFRDTSDRSDRSEGTRHRESVSLWTRFIGDQQKSLNRLQHTISAFNKSIGFSLDAVVANTDQFSAFYNTTIKNTGMSGTAAQDFRSDILDIVKDLNQQYRNQFGGAFNANESLQVLATVVNSGVRNPEYYNEFGDELLEANAAMNINLATLAKFSDKFYRRYNFSSESMESLLNNINENVATTSVSEEDLIRQIEENEFVVAQWLTQREGLTAGSAEFERRQSEINNSLNDTLAYATEVGLENTLSTILKAIEGGQTTSEALMLLQTTGMNVEALTQGYMTDATELLYTVAERMENNGLVQSYANSSYRSEWAKATGFDESILKEVILATEMTPEEFEQLKAERATTESLEEKVEDIYVSAEDRFANDLLDKYGDSLATMQENTGLSLSFLETIANTIIGILGLLTAYTGSRALRDLLGGNDGLMGGLGDLFGGSAGSKGLMKAGANVGIAAIAVAMVAAMVSGIVDGLKEKEEREADIYSEFDSKNLPGLEEGQSYSYGVTGYTVDEKTGEVSDTYGVIARDGETSIQDNETAIVDSYLQELNKGKVYTDQLVRFETEDGRIGYRVRGAEEGNLGRYIGENILNFFGLGGLVGGNYGIPVYEYFKDSMDVVSSKSQETLFDNPYNESLLLDALSRYGGHDIYGYYQSLGLLPEMSADTEMDRLFADLLVMGRLQNYLERGKLVNLHKLSQDVDPQDLISYAAVGDNWATLDEFMGDYLLDENSISQKTEVEGSYAIGTNYVPHDQLAYIHEGEAITPKQYNPAANVNELERLKSQETEVQEGTLTSLKEVASAVKAIQDFLEFWRQDNIDREAIASVKATTSSVNSNLLSLQGYGSY